jgi:hypothetical membrane protein
LSSSKASRLGAVAWLSAVQFFIAQVVVAGAWARPFSLSADYISDLGNTACRSGGDCSPLHAWMNASFIAIGVTMSIGAWLTRSRFTSGWSRGLAAVLFTLAGIGVVLVGVYPENVDNDRHTFGAGINFLTGNLALLLFGVASPPRSRFGAFKALSVLAGAVGLAAVFLFVSGEYLGIGVGGMERAAAYPMAIWQIVAGVRLLARE